jgi:hypothetical protein
MNLIVSAINLLQILTVGCIKMQVANKVCYERMGKLTTTQNIKESVDHIIVGIDTERQAAIALHDAVREKVKFGFNKYFDATPPEYTLSCGRGHCNPKSRLMDVFFRMAGFESYQHFVVIPKDILMGAIPHSRYWMIPKELSHSYVEVKVAGRWCSIDSFIVDTSLLQGAQARLLNEKRSLGYGVRSDSINTWDGSSDAFSQFTPGMMVEDHGRVEDLEAYFQSKQYRNMALGLPFNTMFRFMGEAGVAPMNLHLDKIRQSYQ